MKIDIRRATTDDAELIAHVVCMAVGYDKSHPIYPVFYALAQSDMAQYSYRNTLVATIGGRAVGAIIGYDGALLKELREPIYPLLRQHLGYVPDIEDETEAGEYYLDSLGILPEYRGLGIGRRLINAATEIAMTEGHERVGLIVDFDNADAERLYASLGFRRVGTRLFLGHRMWHMQKSVRRTMKDVRITVKRITQYTDLMAEYENPIEHACNLCLGDSFTSVGGKKPEGLCDSAWETLRPFVEELSAGGGNFFDGWMKNPRSAMLSCNDGFRPVSFYIETID